MEYITAEVLGDIPTDRWDLSLICFNFAHTVQTIRATSFHNFHTESFRSPWVEGSQPAQLLASTLHDLNFCAVTTCVSCQSPSVYLTQTLWLSDSPKSPVRGFATELCRAAVARRVADPGPLQRGDNEGNRNNGSTSSHLHIFPRWPPIHFHVSRWWNWIRTSTNTASYHRLPFPVSGAGDARLMLRLLRSWQLAFSMEPSQMASCAKSVLPAGHPAKSSHIF